MTKPTTNTPRVSMTLLQAKRLYIGAGGPDDHSDSEWAKIHQEMGAVVSAKTEYAAGRIISWWGCWHPQYTQTAFARRVRKLWRDGR